MREKNPSKTAKCNPPGKSTYGPAMQACSPFQRRYIEYTFEHPDLGSRQILRLIGYRHSDVACRQMAHRLNNNELVKSAMLELGSNKYRSKLPKVISAIEQIIDDPKARDRVKVLHGLLDRIGMHPVSETRVTHTYDRDSVIARIASVLERNAGLIPVMNPQQLTATVIAVDESEQRDS